MRDEAARGLGNGALPVALCALPHPSKSAERGTKKTQKCNNFCIFGGLSPALRSFFAAMGRQQRTKQAEPTPYAGSTSHPHDGAHVGKKKAALQARSERDGTSKPSPRAVKAKAAKRDTEGFLSGRNAGGAVQKSKKKKKVAPGDEDDIDDLEEQDDYDQDDSLIPDDGGLEAARSSVAFYRIAQPRPDALPVAAHCLDLLISRSPTLVDPTTTRTTTWIENPTTMKRISKTISDSERTTKESPSMNLTWKTMRASFLPARVVVLPADMLRRPETELVMSGKAAKRAARKVYNSDDEGDAPIADAGAPEPVEGQEEDATMSELDAESDDDLEEGVLTDLRAVERRMRTSARVLGNWKEFGASSGKSVVPLSIFLQLAHDRYRSRSDLVEQLIGDVCQYHGYSTFLAEKFFDLFGVDEVSVRSYVVNIAEM